MEEHKHARGAAVSILGQLGRFLIKLVGLALLSRILTAQEVGQVAMILAIVGVATILSDFGLSLASIRVKVLTPQQATSLFWANILIGTVFSTVTFLAAPLIARFYGVPDLVLLTQILAPVFLINSAAVQFRVQLNRDLRYNPLAFADVISPLIGVAVAVLAATNGLGASSLAIQELVSSLGLLIVCAIKSGWVPKGGINLGSIRQFLGFSAATTATQATNYLTTNLPTVLIGAALGSASAGQYSRAYQILMLPIQQLASPLTRVALPLLARSNPQEFNRRFNQIQLLLGYVLSTPLTLFAIWAYPLVRLTLGPGWEEAAGILEILCIGGCFQAAGYVYYWAYMARNQVTVLFMSELFGRTILVGLVILSIHNGVESIAAAFAGGLFAVWFTTALTSVRYLSLDSTKTFWIFVRSVGIGLSALGIAGVLSAKTFDGQRGLETSIFATAIYFAVLLASLIIPAVRRDMRSLYAVGLLLLRREKAQEPAT